MEPSDSWSAVHAHNRRAWDSRAVRGERFTRPASDDYIADPFARLDTAWLGG